MPCWKLEKDMQTTPRAEALVIGGPLAARQKQIKPSGANVSDVDDADDVQRALTTLRSIRLGLLASLRNG